MAGSTSTRPGPRPRCWRTRGRCSTRFWPRGPARSGRRPLRLRPAAPSGAATSATRSFGSPFSPPPGEAGGIGGLRTLARQLDAAGLPLVFTPGVIHLDTVPRAPEAQPGRPGHGRQGLRGGAGDRGPERAAAGAAAGHVSLVLLELGGAFTAGLAVERGRIVDGLGGSSGPIGWRAAGALDGEVAFLAGEVTKATALSAAASPRVIERRLRRSRPWRSRPTSKAPPGRRASSGARRPTADEILLSGRMAAEPAMRDALLAALAEHRRGPIVDRLRLAGQAGRAGGGADRRRTGWWRAPRAGGTARDREARGTVLDHLHVISPAAARRRLGLRDG